MPDSSSGSAGSESSRPFADLSDASTQGIHPPTATTAVPKWLGKRVGRFRLVSLLGRGTWGKVFEAEDTTLRRRIALKLLPTVDKKGQPASDFDRVASEARAAAALEHPNVITIFEAGRKGEFFYLAMELAEGGSTEEVVHAVGPLDPIRACTLCAEAGDALALAHDCGIVHRDVKPANLLLSRSGRCKVCDFGLAAGGDVSDPLHATKAAGTAHYVAPEVVLGNPADARSDIYSLGCTAYHLLTGRRPFEGLDARDEVLRAQVTRTPPKLASLRPELDEGLINLIEKAMDKDPGKRFVDMHELARGLRLYTMPTTRIETKPAGTGVNLPKWWPAAAAGAGVLTIALTAALLSGGGPAPAGATSAEQPRPAPGRTVSTSIANDVQPAVSHTFRLNTRHWDDRPTAVHVAGDFNAWSESSDAMTESDGIWTATVPLTPGHHPYKFIVTDATGQTRWINDDAADRSLELDDAYGGKNSGVVVRVP
jgi:serine/threonine-protein kinase